MTDCRTCGALDCINVDDYDVYSLQQPSVIAAAQSGRITLSDIEDLEVCVDDDLEFNISASGDSIDGYSEWSVLGGSLPTGLTLESHGSYATISGTPTTVGDYVFSLLVESTNGDRGAKVFSMEITPCYEGCVTTVEDGVLTSTTATSYTSNLTAGQLVYFLIDATANCYVDVYSPSAEWVGYLDAGTLDDAYFIPVESGNYTFEVVTNSAGVPKPYKFTRIVCSGGFTLSGEITGIPPDEDFYSNGSPCQIYDVTLTAGEVVILQPTVTPGTNTLRLGIYEPPYDDITDEVLITDGTYDSKWLTITTTGVYKFVVSEIAASVPQSYSLTYHIFTP